MAIEATDASAQEQREVTCWRGSSPETRVLCAHALAPRVVTAQAYFEMLPSKKLPTVSLDLRAFADKTQDAGVSAGVFARQDETVPEWKNIGEVSAENEAQLTAAVAAQRSLIERWAYEVCNDFETNTLKMSLEQPIELAWAVEPPKPSFFESLQGKKPEAAKRVVVPPDAADSTADAARCGFFGTLAREYRGGGVSARFDRIEIGRPPEVPFRRESQAKCACFCLNPETRVASAHAFPSRVLTAQTMTSTRRGRAKLPAQSARRTMAGSSSEFWCRKSCPLLELVFPKDRSHPVTPPHTANPTPAPSTGGAPWRRP